MKGQAMSDCRIPAVLGTDGQIITAAERWKQLSQIIISGLRTFYEVKSSLIEVQHDKLYKQGGYKTYEECCKTFFHISSDRAYQLMEAVAIVIDIKGLPGR